MLRRAVMRCSAATVTATKVAPWWVSHAPPDPSMVLSELSQGIERGMIQQQTSFELLANGFQQLHDFTGLGWPGTMCLSVVLLRMIWVPFYLRQQRDNAWLGTTHVKAAKARHAKRKLSEHEDTVYQRDLENIRPGLSFFKRSVWMVLGMATQIGTTVCATIAWRKFIMTPAGSEAASASLLWVDHLINADPYLIFPLLSVSIIPFSTIFGPNSKNIGLAGRIMALSMSALSLWLLWYIEIPVMYNILFATAGFMTFLIQMALWSPKVRRTLNYPSLELMGQSSDIPPTYRVVAQPPAPAKITPKALDVPLVPMHKARGGAAQQPPVILPAGAAKGVVRPEVIAAPKAVRDVREQNSSLIEQSKSVQAKHVPRVDTTARPAGAAEKKSVAKGSRRGEDEISRGATLASADEVEAILLRRKRQRGHNPF